VVAMVVAGTKTVAPAVPVLVAVCTPRLGVLEPLGKEMLVALPLQATDSPVVVVVVPVVPEVLQQPLRKTVVLREQESITQSPELRLPMPAVERVLAEVAMETALAQQLFV